MTTGKTIALTVRTFAGKVTSLHFKNLSRFDIAFLLSCKNLLISWLSSLSAVTLELKKIESVTVTVSVVSHLFAMKVWDRCHDLHFLNVEFKANFFTLLFHFHQEAL